MKAALPEIATEPLDKSATMGADPFLTACKALSHLPLEVRTKVSCDECALPCNTVASSDRHKSLSHPYPLYYRHMLYMVLHILTIQETSNI